MSNHFTITGNLGRDGLGALRFTPSGQAVVNFSKYDAKDGTPRTVTTLRADSVALHAPRQGPGQGFDAQSNPGGGWGQQSQGASGWGPPAFAEPPFLAPPVVISGEGRAW